MSEDKNLLNESLKSTAPAAGNAHIYRQDMDNCSERLRQKTELQPEDCCFCTARVGHVECHVVVLSFEVILFQRTVTEKKKVCFFFFPPQESDKPGKKIPAGGMSVFPGTT